VLFSEELDEIGEAGGVLGINVEVLNNPVLVLVLVDVEVLNNPVLVLVDVEVLNDPVLVLVDVEVVDDA
jgi:hypothetical protein